MGIKIGEVVTYNKNKGYVKIKLLHDLTLGDSIQIKDATCKISELMRNNTNIKTMKTGDIATVRKNIWKNNAKRFCI